MITWLVGKNENIDILFTNYKDHILITNPEITMNTYLFEEKNFKYVFNKKDLDLFKKNHAIFQNNIIIKGIASVNKDIMDLNKDEILNIDLMSKNDLFKLFLKISNTFLEENELTYIKKLNTLNHLCTIIALKKMNIELNLWDNFIKENKDFWKQKMENNSLIPEQIIKNNEILPMISYLLSANYHKKPILLFLRAFIRSGNQIWMLNQLWDDLL